MKKALIIFNPSAGTLTKKDIEKEVHDFLIGQNYQPVTINLNPQFEENVEKLNLKELDLIVAVGGDGTVKVAAKTIINYNLQAKIAIIPFGSANILAIALGLPMKIKDSLKLISGNKTKKIDVGVIDHTNYFLVGFTVGYLARIISSTSHDIKNKFGWMGYFFKFIFNKIKMKRIKFKISTQNHTFWVKGNSLLIFNVFNFYGLKPRKKVELDDGVLNLFTITNKTFYTLFEAVFFVLTHKRAPRHVFTLDNNYFKISVATKKKQGFYQADGDPINLPPTFEIKVLKQAIEVITK